MKKHIDIFTGVLFLAFLTMAIMLSGCNNNSYRINNPRYQKDIANLMLQYNEEHPVDPAWHRTYDSIITEWCLHNIAYSLFYKRDRTADCDFNNSDEGVTLWDLLRR